MNQSVMIRPFAATDAESFAEAARESFQNLHTWMPWCHADYSAAEAAEWIDVCHRSAAEQSAFEFAIVSQKDELLGGGGINHVELENRRANLGYWVRTSALRFGVATRACHLLSEWAFQNTDLVRLEIVVAVGNVGSQKVAQRVGAIYEGRARSRLALQGSFHDAYVFSIVRSDKMT